MAVNSPATSTGAKFALGGLITVSCLVVAALAAFIFGGVSGEEFNPHTFQRRHFYFYEIPWLRWQVYPLVRSAVSTPVDAYIESKYVKTTGTPPDDWHLFTFQRSAMPSPPFDAGILKTYLDTRDKQAKYYWQEWSDDHPKLADELWPAVIRLAREKAYLSLPQVFQAARASDNASELKTELTRISLAALQNRAARAQAAQEYAEAVQLFTAILELQPKHGESLRLRAESYRALGDTEKAAADEAAAAQALQEPASTQPAQTEN